MWPGARRLAAREASSPRCSATSERARAMRSACCMSTCSRRTTSSYQLGNSRSSRGDEFHPTLRSKRKEDQIDPLTVDPTLRLDLLAKVQSVKLDGGQRNLFQFGKAELVAATLDGPEQKIVPKVRERMGPKEAPPPPGPAPVVPPPPITMKY